MASVWERHARETGGLKQGLDRSTYALIRRQKNASLKECSPLATPLQK